MIVVVSIHHSGTHFVFEHLLRDYPKIGNDHEVDVAYQVKHRVVQHPEHKRSDGGFRVHVHAEPCNRKQLIWWLSRYSCIVPLRHPLEMVKSWSTRDGKQLDDLIDQYSVLVELDRNCTLHYLPIDSPNRQSYLNQINLELGLNLCTDWPIMMSNGKVSKIDSDQQLLADELMGLDLNQRFYARDDHVFCQYPETTESATGCPAAA